MSNKKKPLDVPRPKLEEDIKVKPPKWDINFFENLLDFYHIMPFNFETFDFQAFLYKSHAPELCPCKQHYNLALHIQQKKMGVGSRFIRMWAAPVHRYTQLHSRHILYDTLVYKVAVRYNPVLYANTFPRFVPSMEGGQPPPRW